MGLAIKHQHDLVAILAAGASLELSAKAKHQHDLVALATAAKTGGSHLTLSDISIKPQHDLIAIATAGKGHVTLRD
ncbi:MULTISPECIES: hypothetical protein [Pseudomonas]|uniref:Uncharacterized protein n=1 Tax=Pseudomonas savastanoi pv. savastanoi NCPPB 3335 TaxID=693985 RepID=A0ABC8BEV9_PSESS|nr:MULTISPECIES: hypothetical protein [Pseudomonas]ARD12858.1 hypothetical protein PSA3335_18435 [Pseudomonas savastanoi pv. savastanoi NCPPB 3335]KAA3536625.1 hypothetical protein DXU85_23110 [Pseudomonas savastanoi]MBA4702870.1 hypothetical protein [Pseudomonas savastanoi pv. savastanoi]TSC36738.1 hypothetical protein FOM00_11860 [Pseudomonas sp. ST1]UKL12353.1 hypothetical protein HQ966_13795 [Pseudomonas savastanoi pv. savastanoi]